MGKPQARKKNIASKKKAFKKSRCLANRAKDLDQIQVSFNTWVCIYLHTNIYIHLSHFD